MSEHCPVPTYSCITDPNDPEGEDPGADEPDEETHNITANPYFAYTDPNLTDDGMGGGMDGLAGAESQQSYREPTIEEQIIAQFKETLNRFKEEEVKDQTDEDTWLWFVTSLEEWLKELEGD